MKTRNCYWLMNHECSYEQRKELYERFGVSKIIILIVLSSIRLL